MKRFLPFAAIAASSVVLFGQGCWSVSSSSNLPYDSKSSGQAQAQGSGDAYANNGSSDSSSVPSTNMNNNASAGLAFPGVLPESETKTSIRMKTVKGDIVIQIDPDQGPNAASNFVYLTKHKFFDGLTFHRREEGFVIQGGDPQGRGTGGPGYQFADDPVKPVGQNPYVSELPAELKAQMPQGSVFYKRGTVAMANAGPNTNGSQFFIMLGDAPLPPSYSIFGHVTDGMNVVDQIQVGDKMTSVAVE
jgi:cyclophilin family peptidyl-prolyl cis-trans isomerase